MEGRYGAFVELWVCIGWPQKMNLVSLRDRTEWFGEG